MKKIILSIFFILLSINSVNAVVTVKNEKIEKVTTMKLQWKTIIVDGNIEFQSYTKIPYDIEVNWDIIFWDWVKILWSISATWDIQAWNNFVVYKKLSWNNISTGNQLVAQYLEAKWNMYLNGKATITKWVDVGWDFEPGSDLTLYGNSTIEWNMKVELDTKIVGTLYVYWNIRSKERFNFSHGKLKIHWDFRTLEESEIEWRIYVYWTKWRRSYYTNKIKINYLLENNKFRGFMWKIDPVLLYNLSESQIQHIHAQIDIKEYQIEQKKKQISLLPYWYSENLLTTHINELQNMENNLIKFIDTYTSKHSRDIQEWKIIQYERENKHKEFLYKYAY